MAAMFETLAATLVYSLAAYAGSGLLFALAFVRVGVERLDIQGARSSCWIPRADLPKRDCRRVPKNLQEILGDPN
jgi:hypothetical protein